MERTTAWTELARRGSAGLEISLLWCRSTNRTKVTVVDTRSGEEFELPVPGADALAAFYHPFAFMGRPGASHSHELQLQR